MIDTHAHLSEECYKDRLDQIIEQMPADNLSKIFTVAYDLKSMIDCVDIAHKYSNVYAIIGVHPENCDQFEECRNTLIDLCKDPKVVGIGEIGLDYYWNNANKDEQQRVFVEQLKIAHCEHLPVAIHVRDAIGDLIQVLKDNKHLLKYGVLIHCFSESVESFRELKKLGCKVAFGGVSTFKNAVKVKQVVAEAELNDFVLETDCPYLTPEPLRGKVQNEPKYVKYILQNIASLKGVDEKTIDNCTTKNALDLFTKAK